MHLGFKAGGDEERYFLWGFFDDEGAVGQSAQVVESLW